MRKNTLLSILASSLVFIDSSALNIIVPDLQRTFEASADQALFLINGGCSDDGFIDFRYGLISRGKDFFNSTLADPDTLADKEIGPDEIDDESFGYVASEIYEKKSGGEAMPRDNSAFSEPEGEEWDFDDEVSSKAQLPKLTEKFF